MENYITNWICIDMGMILVVIPAIYGGSTQVWNCIGRDVNRVDCVI